MGSILHPYPPCKTADTAKAGAGLPHSKEEPHTLGVWGARHCPGCGSQTNYGLDAGGVEVAGFGVVLAAGFAGVAPAFSGYAWSYSLIMS
jgi:hypothetical protein